MIKESIDLTTNRDFRKDSQSSPAVYYKHKQLPWKTAGDFEPAELDTLNYEYINNNMISSNTLFSFTNTWDDNDIFEGRFINFIDTNDMILNRTTTTYVTNLEYTSSWNNNSSIITYKYQYLHKGEPMSIFPTGHRDYIKQHRMIELPYGIQQYYPKRKITYCKECNSKIADVPWNNTMYECFNKICDNCKEKEKKKDLHSKIFYKKKTSSRNHFNGRDFITVPCISRRIPMVKEERWIPKRYIVWNDEPDRRFVLRRYREQEQRREKYVYYKGRELRRREEPWQPKGRISQSYDTIFDNTDWRNMLRMRVNNMKKKGKQQ